ncbi:glycosyltransferase family 4 protein [Kordia sp. YSTF-M3]|uniref:Glycosyltransferase family 4 protein n=1 Tax=Kordia aestuariivivens TaxID=2759037 RepID=A0ABR7QFR9_9FLAO|nr:glycosyltransferase family 4 protein [Kordia aestuariivivens]MBC8757412.1 glycosyltransferase family 4 protein [Kordia aestuariivivens]
MAKKVIIVSYYWPPAGGPGVQRWLKFVKYLRDFDIEPILYVPKNPSYPIIDETFSDDIPKDITILKQSIIEPYAFATLFSKKKTKKISKGIIAKEKQTLIEKLLLYIRGNFFIPDARKYWVKPSVKFLKKYITEHTIETIITTGPPHSLHLIGLKLRKQLPIKWVADFRDPWTTIGYHEELKLTKKSKRKHYKLEAEVLQTADQIVTTSFTTREEFLNLTKQPIEVITNGYDVEKHAKTSLDEKFTISHIGSLLSERNPEILWEVLSELIQTDATFATDFQLQFAGVVSDRIQRKITAAGLSNHTIYFGYVSHQKALQLQRASQVLLVIEIDAEKTKGIIAGKLFEYMAAERPIIGIGPKDADISKIIQETNTGRYFLYTEKEKLKAEIVAYYEAFKTKQLQTSPIGLQKYSRKALTKKLADLLHKLS